MRISRKQEKRSIQDIRRSSCSKLEPAVYSFIGSHGNRAESVSSTAQPCPTTKAITMPTIIQLAGREILDSRGRPTVEARCTLDSGAIGVASVPSGASTGGAEALELRDGDAQRYHGLGCRRAAGHVGDAIQAALAGQPFADQTALDLALLALDGTPNKGRLGANALLAVSLAFARAVAAERGVPLYEHFADILGRRPTTDDRRPTTEDREPTTDASPRVARSSGPRAARGARERTMRAR